MATVTTLHDSNNYLVGFGHQIEILEREEAPLIKLFGASAGNVKKLGRTRDWPSTTLKWAKYPLNATTSEIDGTPGTGTTISVTAGQGLLWRKGDVFLVNATGEKVLVQSVSSDALTVERGFGATSAIAPSNDDVITKIGRVMPEGYPDFETGTVGVIDFDYNYTQIISQAVQVSRTEMKQSNLSIEDQMKFQVARLFNDSGNAGELVKALANTFYYGERIARSTTGSTIASTMGSMGGFDTFVDDTTADTGLVIADLDRSLTKGDVWQIPRNIRQKGGKATHLICNYELMEVLTDMFPGQERMPADTTGGDAGLEMIRTPHGNLTLYPDYMCPSGTIYFVNPKHIGWIPFDEFFYKHYKEEGDTFVTDVIGEYTFAVRHGDTSHGKIAGIEV